MFLLLLFLELVGAVTAAVFDDCDLDVRVYIDRGLAVFVVWFTPYDDSVRVNPSVYYWVSVASLQRENEKVGLLGDSSPKIE